MPVVVEHCTGEQEDLEMVFCKMKCELWLTCQEQEHGRVTQ